MAKFRNPISISRQELMSDSKIGSVNTYLRCLRQLDKWAYIQYIPSYNPQKGSKVHLYDFSTDSDTGGDTGTGIGSDMPVIPSINSINTLNNIKVVKGYEHNKKINHDQNKKNCPLGKNIPPSFQEVQEFFRAEKYPDVEAQKFFNHFESNGWKIGGRSDMKNWHAATINWMLNASNFKKTTDQAQPSNLHAKTNKDYSEPL